MKLFMPSDKPVILNRDCEAVQIPSGVQVKLAKGTPVRVTQSLGGSYTLMTEEGYMVRIAGKDADAIGKQDVTRPKTEGPVGNLPLDQLVWDQLRTCYDPEIPVNIVELGLVYECKLTPSPELGGGTNVDIKMTLTAPGCGMGEALRQDARAKIERLPGIKKVNVELIWNPPWNQSMMSEAAKLQLGMM